MFTYSVSVWHRFGVRSVRHCEARNDAATHKRDLEFAILAE
jgi:hypothetical protein